MRVSVGSRSGCLRRTAIAHSRPGKLFASVSYTPLAGVYNRALKSRLERTKGSIISHVTRTDQRFGELQHSAVSLTQQANTLRQAKQVLCIPALCGRPPTAA